MLEEAKEMVPAGVEEAREKVYDLVRKAKAAVYLAEERAEAKVDAKLLHVSEVDTARMNSVDSDILVFMMNVRLTIAALRKKALQKKIYVGKDRHIGGCRTDRALGAQEK